MGPKRGQATALQLHDRQDSRVCKGILPDMDDAQSVFDLLGKVLHVLLILGRQQYCLDTCPKSTYKLLFNATNRRYSSAERKLALLHVILATWLALHVNVKRT